VSELLFVTVAIQVVLALSLVATLLRPSSQIWPPPSAHSWQFHFTWLGKLLHLSGVLLLGVLAWGSLGFPGWLRFALGAPLIVLGLGFMIWGVHVLSTQASLGLGGRLVRAGPYRCSRNPQCVGVLLLLAGWALLSSSGPAVWACLGASVWYILAPFVEEPWLRAQFGVEYDAYARAVPRFLGVRRRTAAA
jgi:protein-S-isoprenylcysteine O-methyltransferase Ste14